MVRHGIVHAGRFNAQTIPAIDFIWTSLVGKPAHVPVFWVYVAVPGWLRDIARPHCWRVVVNDDSRIR